MKDMLEVKDYEESLCRLGETQHTLKYGPFIEGGRIKDTVVTIHKSLVKDWQNLPLYVKFTISHDQPDAINRPETSP